jgi:hypothetical protein
LAIAGAHRVMVEAMPPSQIMEPVASVSLIWVDAKGTERPVTGIIGKPYPNGDQWACSYVLDGAFEPGPDIAGGDSIQALSLALYGLYHDLLRLLSDGGRLLNAKNRETFDLVTLKATFSRSTSQFQAVM